MTEKDMLQSCKADRVLKNKNWDEYMWPHQIEKTDEPEQKTKQPQTQHIIINTNVVKAGSTQGFSSFGSTFNGVTNNYYN